MIGFTALSGWLLAALSLLLAGVLAVLHYLRIRPRQIRVITTLFWQQASEQVRARSLFEKFRHPFTYLLLLLAGLLVLLALAKPVFDDAGQPYRVIVLEAGISMTSTDNRFEKAIELVHDEVARSPEERVAVIVADPEPRLLKHFEEGLGVLKIRLDALKPVDQPVIRTAVLRIAKSLIAQREIGEVVLVSAQPVVLSDPKVRVQAVGEVINNAFIFSATFVPDATDMTRGEFHWCIGFNGQQDGKTTVLLRRNDEILQSEDVTLKPGSTREFYLSDIDADGSTLSASVFGNDCIRGDNQIDFRLPNRQLICLAPIGGTALPGSLKSLADLLMEISASETEVAEGATVIGVGPKGTDARIVIWSAERKGALQPLTATRHPLVDGLVFEDALCRVPANPLSVSETSIPLLLAGSSPVAVWDSNANRLVVSELFFDESASVVRRTGYLVFWNRVLHRLAGWSHVPLVLTPLQSRYSDFDHQASLAFKADINHAKPVEGVVADAISGRTFQMPLWQFILGTALFLMLLEAILNIRGRIA